MYVLGDSPRRTERVYRVLLRVRCAPWPLEVSTPWLQAGWSGSGRRGRTQSWKERGRSRATVLFLSPPSLQARDWLSAPSAAPETFQRPTPARRPAGPPALPPPGGEGHLAQAALRRTGTGAGRHLEAFLGGQETKDTTGVSAQFSVSFQDFFGNSPQKLARQGLRLNVTLETRFQAM